VGPWGLWQVVEGQSVWASEVNEAFVVPGAYHGFSVVVVLVLVQVALVVAWPVVGVDHGQSVHNCGVRGPRLGLLD